MWNGRDAGHGDPSWLQPALSPEPTVAEPDHVSAMDSYPVCSLQMGHWVHKDEAESWGNAVSLAWPGPWG